MEMTTARTGRRNGWSEQEDNLLWETASEAQKNATPLKQVFDEIARKTGRKPNSIRNYYYAQAQKREGTAHTQRFIPFDEEEVYALVERVLRARAEGRSVRSCLTELAQGDHRLMLRYQNKYRSVLKTRPDLVEQVLEMLDKEGVNCRVMTREKNIVSMEEAAGQLRRVGRDSGDGEISQMCETICRLIAGGGRENADRLHVRLDLMRIALDEKEAKLRRMCTSGEEMVQALKEWIMLPEGERARRSSDMAERFKELLGPLEECLTENAPKLQEEE